MNLDQLTEQLKNLFGEGFILQSTDNELYLDITELEQKNASPPTPCTLFFKNAEKFLAINVKVLSSLDKVFQETKNEQICDNDYLEQLKKVREKAKINLLKICDAIVIAEKNNQLLLNVVEFKETIGRFTLYEKVFPQLDISCTKFLWLLSLFLDNNFIQESTINFFMISNTKQLSDSEKDRIKLDRKNIGFNDFDKFQLGKTIVKDIPFVLKKELLNSSFQRQKVKVFHKEINAEIDISELN